MAFQRKKFPTGTSPRGVAVFPHLNKPDDKFDKVVFKTNLSVPAAEAADLVSRIEAMLAALASNDAKMAALLSDEEAKRMATAHKLKKLKPADAAYGPQTDKEGNVDETKVVFKFKKNGNFKDKTGEIVASTLPLFDAKGAVYEGGDIWGGSEIKVSYELRPWVNAKNEYGVKLAMRAVQVLVQRQGGSDASAFGFDNEGGDEEGETKTAAPKMPVSDDSDGDF